MVKQKKQKAKKKRPRYYRQKPGTPPGTILANPNSKPSTVRVIAYGPDDFIEADIDKLQSISGFIEKWPVTWINVNGLANTERIIELGEILKLHALALEDIFEVPQRAKTERYGDHLFIITRMAYPGETIETEQLSLFVGKNFLVTFQEHPGDCLDVVRERIRAAAGRIRNVGADYLAYAILDAVVDNYFPVLEEYGERNEDLLDLAIQRPDNETITRIHAAKHDLLTVRRSVWPMREAINALLRDEMPPITSETQLYLRDCYDHVIQLIDILENYRELASGLLEAYMSSLSNKMNEVMKVLTIIATIFIPLTFIAGIYGMNFKTETSPFNMPELSWPWGYPFVLLLMATVAILMLIFFRRKGWFGSINGKNNHNEKD